MLNLKVSANNYICESGVKRS